MAQLATKTIEQEPAVPAAAIDRGQLARMTFGDRSLEREVLQLFDRQAVLLLARMHAGEPAVIGPLAHTLRGSAASIGAENVVRAAQSGRTGDRRGGPRWRFGWPRHGHRRSAHGDRRHTSCALKG